MKTAAALNAAFWVTLWLASPTVFVTALILCLIGAVSWGFTVAMGGYDLPISDAIYERDDHTFRVVEAWREDGAA